MPRPGLDRNGLFAYLQERADTNAGKMAGINRIIRDDLRPLLRDPVRLGDDEADALFGLAQRLFTLTVNLDLGLALEIHQGLLARAAAKGDEDRAVRHLYWIGLAYEQCDPLLFRKEAAVHFAKAALRRNRYFDIKCKETRQYINRCVGNVYVCLATKRHIDPKKAAAPFFRKVDEALRFWNDGAVRAADPDFPWDAFIANAHQNVCGWIDVLQNLPWDSPDPALAARVYDSYRWLAKGGAFDTASKFWPPSRLEYIGIILDYYMGRIGFNDALEGVAALIRRTADDDYTEEGLFCKYHLPSVLIALLNQSREMPREQLKQESDALIDQVLEYSKHLPGGADRQRVNSRLGLFIKHGIMRRAGSASYLDLLLRFTSLSHLSTYVHSIQVRDIAGILARHALRHVPEVFAALPGGPRKPEDLLQLVRQAGLCHDIGKVSYVNTVALCSRQLYGFEFAIIKDHVSAGDDLRADGETMRCVKDAITGHHKWYDGTHGYPDGFDNRASPFAPVIDIISIADTIDAATDAVGRSYAAAHTLDQITAEIRAQAGTRYAPAIAGMLGDPALYAEIGACVKEGRKEAYYQAYVDLTSRDMGSVI
jgi:HD-GYP domain-containing protein (c-di-GMP phosphodiesterase class II)